MTRDEILKMEAGAELDALVAEKAMKWERAPRPVECYDYFIDENSNPRYVLNEPLPGMCWMPSKRISDAWEVLERVLSIGIVEWEVRYSEAVNGSNDNYMCWLATEKESVFNFAPSAPLAICRAALLAVMESE